MEQLFQGEKEASGSENKFFRKVLLFSVNFPDSFFLTISLVLICFTHFCPFTLKFQKVLLLFSWCLTFQPLRRIVNDQSHMYSVLFVVVVTPSKHFYECWFREAMIHIIVSEGSAVKTGIFEMRALQKQYDSWENTFWK